MDGKHEALARALIAAWPSQHDLDIICTLPVGLSVYHQIGICKPHSGSVDQSPLSPREMLQLPSKDSHPVLIARKLLVLGTFLQGVLPSSMKALAGLGTCFRDLMARVVDTAIRLVTTSEDLIRSVEGLECVLIEAHYHNYAGNLHHAWMAVRRGISIAQMMVLHRGLRSPSLKILEPETRATFDADHISFRLVEMDCYLSLALGLPQSSLEARIATPKALEGCYPVNRMQRIHCAAARRIIQRNNADVLNLADTQTTDKLLEKAAAEMPPQWWLLPNFASSNNDSVKVARETLRLMDQFMYYYLLIWLHLPYMLQASPDHRYDHSKITAVNASRETLTRFVAFRTLNAAHFYCRGSDFLTFTATVVLCVAHINSCSQRHENSDGRDFSPVFDSLAHSRPSDRGLMERTLDIMESMARADDTDVIASKFARIIRHLLDVEASGASGTRYTTKSSQGNEREVEYDGRMADGGRTLHVYIPYLGAIDFERGTIPKSAPIATKTATPPRQSNPSASTTNMGLQGQWSEHDRRPSSEGNSGPLHQLDSSSGNPDSQVAPPPSGNEPNAPLPWAPEGLVSAEEDDWWDLQGVDIALFDNLFRGTTTALPGALDEEETWTQWAENG